MGLQRHNDTRTQVSVEIKVFLCPGDLVTACKLKWSSDAAGTKDPHKTAGI